MLAQFAVIFDGWPTHTQLQTVADIDVVQEAENDDFNMSMDQCQVSTRIHSLSVVKVALQCLDCINIWHVM